MGRTGNGKRGRPFHYDEGRFTAVGMVDNRVLVVAFAWRDDIRRIISARKATRIERRKFEEEIRKRS